MRKWNIIAMGQVGVAGVVTSKVTKPIVNSIARRTGRSEDQVSAIIGAGILAISLIYFLRTAQAVIAAGRRMTDPPGTLTRDPSARRIPIEDGAPLQA